jgi:Na+-driven multidrug efflux pump
MFINIFKIAFPAAIFMFLAYMLPFMNLSFVGHLDNSNYIAAVGLGNMIYSIFVS